MKKLLFTILFAFSISVNAQYYSITFVNVPQENIAEFQMLETNYWSKVAKANIDAGKQLSWGLVARVGGGTDSWNHAFVNVYETAEQMTDLSIWDPKSILGIDQELISTGHLTTGMGVTLGLLNHLFREKEQLRYGILEDQLLKINLLMKM